jgi:hypothetical protein
LKAGSSNCTMSTPSACSASASWFSSSAKAKASLHAVAVAAVGHGVDDGHGPRQRELDLPARVRAQEARLGGVHAAFQRSGATTCGTIAL